MTNRERETILQQIACDVANGKLTHEQAEIERQKLLGKVEHEPNP